MRTSAYKALSVVLMFITLTLSSSVQAQYKVPPGFSVQPFTTIGLARPYTIVLAPPKFGQYAGSLFIVNRNNFLGAEIDYISRIPTSGADAGTAYRFAEIGASDPYGMTFNPSGTRLLVSTNNYNGQNNGNVLQVSPDGTTSVYSPVGGGNGPSAGLAFDPTGAYGGSLFLGFSALDGLGRIDGPGQNASLFSYFGPVDGTPAFIGFGPGGAWDASMYVTVISYASTWNILLPGCYKVSTSGQLIPFATMSTSNLMNFPGEFAFAKGGAFGTDMYVANLGSILKVTPNGEVSVFATGFDSVTGIVFTDSDTLYVADWYTNQIVQIKAKPFWISLAPSSVIGKSKAIGTVSLRSPAPNGGAVVTLANTNSAAVVPATVTIPAGKTSATFTITTSSVTDEVDGTVSATYNALSDSADLNVLPVRIDSLTLSANTVYGGFDSPLATLTLQAPAAPGPITVNLSSSNPTAASVPASIVFSSGQRVKTFRVKTAFVGSNTTAAISATANGATTTANLIVQAGLKTKQVIAYSPANSKFVRGTTLTVTVTLTDIDGNPLVDELVNVIIDVRSTGQKSLLVSGQTDENGQLSAPYTVPTDISQSKIVVETSFATHRPFLKSSASRQIYIK
ncbi:hypothetical protein LBMAG21_05610 [Armatimonadota bacterium]|nr:hypothetical protein LBMAG21_05610 [Armatimonadota bacterium]